MDSFIIIFKFLVFFFKEGDKLTKKLFSKFSLDTAATWKTSMTHTKAFSGQSIGSSDLWESKLTHMYDPMFRIIKSKLGLRIFILNIYQCLAIPDVSSSNVVYSCQS